jgi:hypothetical protein
MDDGMKSNALDTGKKKKKKASDSESKVKQGTKRTST